MNIRPKSIFKWLVILLSIPFVFPALVILGYYIRVWYEKRLIYDVKTDIAKYDEGNQIDDNLGVIVE